MMESNKQLGVQKYGLTLFLELCHLHSVKYGRTRVQAVALLHGWATSRKVVGSIPDGVI